MSQVPKNLNQMIFETRDVCATLGISRITLTDWIVRGFVEPTFKRAQKQGEKNLYSFDDILNVALFKALIDFGFSRELASEMSARVVKYKISIEGS